MGGHRWLGLAAAAVVSAGALVSGLLIGPGTPARAASLGAVEMSEQGGDVGATPMFTTATGAACPAGYGENAGLRVGRPGGPYSNLVRAQGGGGLDQGPVTFHPDRSFTTALGGTAPGEGEWWVIIECFSLTEGRHPDQFQTTITVCGQTWRVGTGCGTAQPTTTALTVGPGRRVAEGTAVTLAATVDPAVPGTVVFLRRTGTETVELDEVAATGGTATLAVPELPGPPGTEANAEVTHALSATFRPADPNAYAASTSTAIDVTVFRGTAVVTTTTLTVTPPSPAPAGAVVELTAAVTTTGGGVPAGSVRFERRPNPGAAWTAIGTVPLADGNASRKLEGDEKLTDGSYYFQAVFAPTDPAAFTGSTGGLGDPYLVGTAGQGAVSTTTTLAVAPASPTEEGAELTLAATVQPATAVGNVRFFDGTTQLDSVALNGGAATYKTSALAVGAHPLKAEYVPADPTAHTASSSAVTQHEVIAPGGGDGGGDGGGGDGGDGGGGDGGGDGAGGGGLLASTGTPLAAIGATGLALVAAGVATRLLAHRRRRGDKPGEGA
jgi:hypothetical protein